MVEPLLLYLNSDTRARTIKIGCNFLMNTLIYALLYPLISSKITIIMVKSIFKPCLFGVSCFAMEILALKLEYSMISFRIVSKIQ